MSLQKKLGLAMLNDIFYSEKAVNSLLFFKKLNYFFSVRNMVIKTPQSLISNFRFLTILSTAPNYKTNFRVVGQIIQLNPYT